MFLKLISVKGLGPKIALPILTYSINDINNAIITYNTTFFKKFPKIGEKLANQIIFDLKRKVTNNTKNKVDLTYSLKSLGYKQSEIEKVLPKLDDSISIEEKIKQALTYLGKTGT